MLLEELTRRHQVSVFALAWDDADREALELWQARGAKVHITPHGKRAMVRAVVTHPQRPLQRLIATSADLARAVRHELRSAQAIDLPYDVVHIEHLRGAAAVDILSGLGTRVVLDAVDCIAELARLTRQHNPSQITRLLARSEEGPTRRYEIALVEAADAVTVVAERDRAALSRDTETASISVVPNGVMCLSSPVPLTQEPIAIFSGKLSYHANQAAVQRLLSNVWPRVQAAVPEARLIIAGADAPRWLLRHDGTHGVSIHDSPENLKSLIASARVSVAPIVYSVGIQNKVLEAMACGVPVVATSSALNGLLPAANGTLLYADDDVLFAFHIARLLSDTSDAQRLGKAGYDYVASHHSWSSVAQSFESLYVGPSRVERAA